MPTTLTEKRVIITGGSSGIGLALARKLISDGAKVLITGRNEARLAKAGTDLGAFSHCADVGSEAGVESTISQAVADMGGIDILVNNAGEAARGRVEDIDAESFARVLRSNLIGPALMMKAVLPHFEEAKGGDVVNVASTAALRGYPGGSMYAATKFGLRGLSQCWQAELRPKNIRVIEVNPSEVQTPFGGRMMGTLDPKKLVAEDVADVIVSALALPGHALVPEVTLYATNPWRDA